MSPKVPGPSPLEEIVKEFENPYVPGETGAIPRQRVLEWMGSDDIEALGALYSFIMKKPHLSRIQPPLDFLDYHKFVLAYYGRCFRENPDGDWSDSRFSAGWDLVNWFKGIWKDKQVPRSAIAEWKRWLADMYKGGNEELRNCIVTATLEHLFEDKEIARFFADWQEDAVLVSAYRDAMEWTGRGGASDSGFGNDG